MKYLPLVWAALWRKPLRTTFTMLSLVVAFLLYGSLKGVGDSVDAWVARTKDDRIYTDPRFNVPLPISYTEQIEAVPGVKFACPRNGFGGYYQDPKNNLGIIVTSECFFQARDELTATKADLAKWAATRNGLIMSLGVATRLGLKAGDTVPLVSNTPRRDGTKDWVFEITAIVDDVTNPGKSTYTLGHYEYINEERADGGENKVTRFLIRVDDPDRVADISREIDAKFANSPAPTRTQADRVLAQSQAQQLGDVNLFVNSVVGSVMLMLLFLTTNTMMQAFRERVPELAVLKTLGFGDNAMLGLVIAESMLQCLIGSVLGLALARLLMPVMRSSVPNLPQQVLNVPWLTLATGIAFAILVAVVSGVVPAWKAKRLQVVDGLADR